MKALNLIALEQVTLEEAVIFIRWLEQLPTGGVSLEQLKKGTPIRTSKVGFALKLLESFRFVRLTAGHYVITPAGLVFAKADSSAAKSMIRASFVDFEPMKRLLELLSSSPSGRLPKHVLVVSFGADSSGPISEAETRGVIAWSERCDLFGYDRKKDEIFKLESGLPGGPTLKKPEFGQVIPLPRAS
jgi:hypothetical protein